MIENLKLNPGHYLNKSKNDRFVNGDPVANDQGEKE
jgi:hypothetical protein